MAKEEFKEVTEPEVEGCGCDGEGTVMPCSKDEHQEDVDECMAPGTQSIYVKTYGCSHNISDSEYMAGLLADYGFRIVDTMERAHACLLNSCTVKNPSQEKFINLVAKAQAMGKPVIVSGCVP